MVFELLFELLVECILYGNDKQKELAFQIIEEFLKEQDNDNNS